MWSYSDSLFTVGGDGDKASFPRDNYSLDLLSPSAPVMFIQPVITSLFFSTLLLSHFLVHLTRGNKNSSNFQLILSKAIHITLAESAAWLIWLNVYLRKLVFWVLDSVWYAGSL